MTGRPRPRAPAAGGGRLPNVTVVDQDGRPHRFYDDLVKGRVVTLNFFFASCGDTCPLVTQNLAQVQDLLGPRCGRDVFMYSLTLQPEVDTPEVLRDYAESYGSRPGWRFLTGAKDDIELLRRRLGFASADPELDVIKDEHTGLLRYGSDAARPLGRLPRLVPARVDRQGAHHPRGRRRPEAAARAAPAGAGERPSTGGRRNA